MNRLDTLGESVSIALDSISTNKVRCHRMAARKRSGDGGIQSYARSSRHERWDGSTSGTSAMEEDLAQL